MHMAIVSGYKLPPVFPGETGSESRKQEREWEARQEAISDEVPLLCYWLQPLWKDVKAHVLSVRVGPGNGFQWLKHCLLRKNRGLSPQE